VSLAVGDTIIADTGLLETCVDPPPNGGSGGAFAEYAIVPEKLAAKIKKEDARTLAGLPLAGLTSYQALFTGGHSGPALGSIAKGGRLLVLGGATAVGAAAIQLAVARGARVFTTASKNSMPDGTSKMDYCTGLGATAIDYKERDWSEELSGEEIELIFDCGGDNKDWQRAPKVLRPGGRFITISNFAPEPQEQSGLKCEFFIKHSVLPDLEDVMQHVAAGQLKVAVDSVLPFAEVPAALTKSLQRTSAGKLVIEVAGDK